MSVSVSHCATPGGSALAGALAAETWYVATASGVGALTLEELERALANGGVDATTPVWIPGMAEWEALGQVANVEDGPPLDQGPGAPPPHELGRAAGGGDLPAPDPSQLADGPLSRPWPGGAPHDSNAALWQSILPRPARPSQSGIWRRVHRGAPGPAASRQRRMLRAAVVAGLLLLLLAAWQRGTSGLERSEQQGAGTVVAS